MCATSAPTSTYQCGASRPTAELWSPGVFYIRNKLNPLGVRTLLENDEKIQFNEAGTVCV